MTFFRIDDAGIAFLKQHWELLVGQSVTSSSAADALFNSITELYSAKDRAYHNLSHIKALLELCNSVRGRIQSYGAVRFAIWFHDVIYDTRKSDNEDRSAEFAAEAMGRLSVPAETIAAVREMILATKGHSPAGASADLKLFLDLDLSILGAPEEIYRAYSQAIRREYSWVPGFIYRRERKKILNSFLGRDKLYFTEPLAAKCEAQARRNIAWELENL
ncbi:MAG TPA: hypothetical protein VFD58_07050 [Blastocatellia bacterium]|nr:hypothetical protein [Blastocatellia bacterium]